MSEFERLVTFNDVMLNSTVVVDEDGRDVDYVGDAYHGIGGGGNGMGNNNKTSGCSSKSKGSKDKAGGQGHPLLRGMNLSGLHDCDDEEEEYEPQIVDLDEGYVL